MIYMSIKRTIHVKFYLFNVPEQPPNVRLVDEVTRAEVTTPHAWIKDRPIDWDDTIHIHKIYKWVIVFFHASYILVF